MNEIAELLNQFAVGALAFLRAHMTRELRLTIYALILWLLFYVIFLALERVYGKRGDTSNYNKAGFFHDSLYWFYHKSYLDKAIFSFLFFSFLEKPLSFLDLKLLSGMPGILQFCIGLTIVDFFGYWYHRASHRVPILWAFHTTHHSQRHLNFATGYRFHPLDTFFKDLCVYIPLRVMGVSFEMSVPIFLFLSFYGATHHAQVPWTFGRFSRIFISPVFHRYHHSTNPAHFDKNFSSTIFSFWDHLFGTAVKEGEPLPTKVGLDDVPQGSFVSTLTTPFLILFRNHKQGREEST